MSVDIFSSTSTSWTCPYCTFINKSGLTICAACYQTRPGHINKQKKTGKNQKQKETWKEWLSRKMGLSNSSNKPSTKSDKSNSKEALKCTSDTPWTCPHCTYDNTSTAIVCKGCGYCKKRNDAISDEFGSHYKLPAGHDGTPVDIITIDDDDDDDDVKIIDPEGQPSYDDTKCSKCDLKTNSKCLCCDTSNMKLISSDKEGSTFDPATQWECADCSYYNDNKQFRCAACDCTNKKANIVPTDQSSAPFNLSTHWECPRCSLHNCNKDLQCRVCRNRRKHPSVDEPANSFDPVEQWQCANCSLYNSNKQTRCSACNGTKKTNGKFLGEPFNQSTHWRCPVCPVINIMADVQCVACGNRRKHAKVDTFNPATQWECAKCSLYNDNKYSQCQACHSTKKNSPNLFTSALNPATHWECMHCSLHNSNSRSRCEACHQLRPKSGIQVKPVTPVSPVIPYTKEISNHSEPETSVDSRTRLYNNHTALMSLSVKNKRDLIGQDALNIYREIRQFCEKVIRVICGSTFVTIFYRSGHPINVSEGNVIIYIQHSRSTLLDPCFNFKLRVF